MYPFKECILRCVIFLYALLLGQLEAADLSGKQLLSPAEQIFDSCDADVVGSSPVEPLVVHASVTSEFQPSLGAELKYLTMFALEQKDLSRVFNMDVAHIQHIGSTAVFGLIPSSTVDIMVGLPVGMGLMKSVERALMEKNYLIKTPVETCACGSENIICFIKRTPEISIDLYIVRFNGEFWRKSIALLNLLKSSDLDKFIYNKIRYSYLPEPIECDKAEYFGKKAAFWASNMVRALST